MKLAIKKMFFIASCVLFVFTDLVFAQTSTQTVTGMSIEIKNESQISQLKQDIDKLKKSLEEMQQGLKTQLDNEFKKTSQEIDTQKTENTRLKDSLDTMKSQLQFIGDQINTISDSIQKLKDSFTVTNTEMNILQDSSFSQEKTLKNLENNVKENSEKIEDLDSTLIILRKDQVSTMEQVNFSQKKINTLQGKDAPLVNKVFDSTWVKAGTLILSFLAFIIAL